MLDFIRLMNVSAMGQGGAVAIEVQTDYHSGIALASMDRFVSVHALPPGEAFSIRNASPFSVGVIRFETGERLRVPEFKSVELRTGDVLTMAGAEAFQFDGSQFVVLLDAALATAEAAALLLREAAPPLMRTISSDTRLAFGWNMASRGISVLDQPASLGKGAFRQSRRGLG